MDTTHNGDWHGKLEVAGSKPIMLDGTIQQIMLKVAIALKPSTIQPRADADGVKQMTLTFRDKPFNLVSNHGLPREFLDALDLTGVEMMTQEEADAIDANKPLWEDDPEFKQFRFLQATQSNYATAMPGEVVRLQDSLRAKYGGFKLPRADGSSLNFDDLIIDKRKF